MDAAGYYGLSAFLGSVAGKLLAWRLTRNGKRKWLVALLLFTYIAAATLSFFYISILKIIEDTDWFHDLLHRNESGTLC